jgi:hypothetical protein
VVLKKQSTGFVEFASTSEPYEFFEDRIVTKNITISQGIITVDIIGKGPKDPGCCPSLPMTKKFKLVGSKIVELKG